MHVQGEWVSRWSCCSWWVILITMRVCEIGFCCSGVIKQGGGGSGRVGEGKFKCKEWLLGLHLAMLLHKLSGNLLIACWTPPQGWPEIYTLTAVTCAVYSSYCMHRWDREGALELQLKYPSCVFTLVHESIQHFGWNVGVLLHRQVKSFTYRLEVSQSNWQIAMKWVYACSPEDEPSSSSI